MIVLAGDLSLWTLTDTSALREGLNINPMNSHLGSGGTCKLVASTHAVFIAQQTRTTDVMVDSSDAKSPAFFT
jgi:hypothetical protein